jgi:signal transduction histidine kinase
VPKSAAVLGPLASGRQQTVGNESLVVEAIPGVVAPAQSAGVVQLALDGSTMEQDVIKLRSDLQKKVIAWAFLSIVVLIVGFLYVLKLLQRTRRLEAEAQLADRLAYIGTLASGLAHEIRNPLNAMNMNLQLLEEELPSPQSDTRELLETTRGEIGRLDRLVTSFLAYARPSPLALERRRLSAVLDELVQFLRAEFTRHGVELRANYPADLPELPIDEGQIKQALMNILINARQVLKPGQTVELSAGPSGEGEVMIRISDNGPGIEPEALARVFEVFYSTRSGGTGLGLPIAQRIVEAHGGRIEMDSSPGHGTTFRIFLKRRRPGHGALPAPFEGGRA